MNAPTVSLDLAPALVVAPDESSDQYGYGLVQARDAIDWNPDGAVAACHLAYLPSIRNR